MNIEKIEINGHYVLVDKDAEIKEGDYIFSQKSKSIFKADSIEFLEKHNLIEDFDKSYYISSLVSFKIIAASPELNLEGVPTYVEWLFENQKIELNGGNLIQIIKDVFIKGYQIAENELPTWDDVRKAITMARETEHGLIKSKEEIIEQLKQSKK